MYFKTRTFTHVCSWFKMESLATSLVDLRGGEAFLIGSEAHQVRYSYVRTHQYIGHIFSRTSLQLRVL